MKLKRFKVQKADKEAEIIPLLADTTGGPTMEWTLLLGFMALPAYWIIKMLLATLTAYYGMMTTINAMPLP